MTALITAEELHDVGTVDVDLDDVVSEWQRPSYDVATSSLGVFDGDRLVAYADLVHADFGYTGVLPAERGRGIGTALADWLEALARSRGAELISNQVPQGGAAYRLLVARGYRERWTAWDLELPEGAEIAAQPLPDGYAIREARPRRARGLLRGHRGRLQRVARPRLAGGLRRDGLGTARSRAVEPARLHGAPTAPSWARPTCT